MNIIDSIIIGVSLISILIVIVVITRSFKRVDKDIIENIQNHSGNKNKQFIKKIKRIAISLLEWFVKNLKKAIQNIHSWVIKTKKTSESDFIKAKEELMIDDHNKQGSVKKLKTPKNTNQKSNVNEDVSVEGNILEVLSSEEKDIVVDSVVQGTGNNKKINKNNFIKGLFKGKKTLKKNVDIKTVRNNTFKEWSLTDSDVIDNDKQVYGSLNNGIQNINPGEDVAIGVDRKILEKKILQRIDKDPVNMSNYHELGELYIKMKKYEDAMEVFKYVLTVTPDDLEAKRRQDKIELLRQAA